MPAPTVYPAGQPPQNQRRQQGGEGEVEQPFPEADGFVSSAGVPTAVMKPFIHKAAYGEIFLVPYLHRRVRPKFVSFRFQPLVQKPFIIALVNQVAHPVQRRPFVRDIGAGQIMDDPMRHVADEIAVFTKIDGPINDAAGGGVVHRAADGWFQAVGVGGCQRLIPMTGGNAMVFRDGDDFASGRLYARRAQFRDAFRFVKGDQVHMGVSAADKVGHAMSHAVGHNEFGVDAAFLTGQGFETGVNIGTAVNRGDHDR